MHDHRSQPDDGKEQKAGSATPTGADDPLDAASRHGDTHQHECQSGHTLEVARRHVGSVAWPKLPIVTFPSRPADAAQILVLPVHQVRLCIRRQVGSGDGRRF